MKGWVTKRLGDVCERVTVGHVGITAPFYRDEGIMFLRTQNVGKLGLELDDVKYITPDFHASLTKSEVKSGDILMSRVITHTVNCALVPNGLGVANCANVVLVRPGKAVVPEFLAHYIRSPLAQKHLLDRKVGSAQLVVNTTVVKEWPVPLPPLAEQQRIVGVLDEAFEGLATSRANAEKNLQNARALFESHLQAVFTQRGPGWVETTLEKVLTVQPQNGWSPPAANHAASGTPVLTLSSVTGFVFRPGKLKYTSAKTDPKARYWIQNGDFLITRSNTPELVGHVAIASGIERPTIYPDLIMRMNPDPAKAVTEFLYYQMQTPALREEITGRAQGANPTMKKISNGAVKSLPIVVPPISTQKAIATQLDALSAETQRLTSLYERKLAALAALKKALLNQAFAGAL